MVTGGKSSDESIDLVNRVDRLIEVQSRLMEEVLVVQQKLLKPDISPWFLEAVADRLQTIVLCPMAMMHAVEFDDYHLTLPQKLNYNEGAAYAYAKKYCGQEANSCGKFYPDHDCAHFISHCLASGGVGFRGGNREARCPDGLIIRAEELAAAFYNSTPKYSNVKQIDSYDQGRVGDYGFLRRFVEKSHAFLLAAPISGASARVYAHTNPHCGDEMQTIRTYFGKYYRIEN